MKVTLQLHQEQLDRGSEARSPILSLALSIPNAPFTLHLSRCSGCKTRGRGVSVPFYPNFLQSL